MHRRMWCLILLFLLLATLRVQAQSADVSYAGEPVTISAPWRFQTGDNPQWASPAFDDSQWALLQTGESWTDQGYPDYSGYAWYRIRVKLPQGATPLGIELGRFYTCAEVYVDGRLAGNIGRMRPTPRWDYAPGTNVVPLPAGSAGSVSIAVRFWEKPKIAHYRPGGFLGHPRIGALNDLAEADFSRRASFLADHLPDLVMDGLAACLGLFSLALFVLRRRATEYAWGGLWLLSYAASRAGEVIPVLLGSQVSAAQEISDSLLFVALFIFCLMFVWRFLAARADMLLRAGITLSLLALTVYPLMINDWISVTAGHILYFMLVATITIIMFLRLIRSAVAGNFEARLLLVPFLLMMGVEDATQICWVLFSFRILSSPRLILSRAGPFTIYYNNLFDLPAIMALGLALVIRFTRSAERDERMSAELDAARRVQEQLVPSRLPSIPNLQFEAAYLPAAEVGGDFYQVIPQPSGATLVVVGDVSGKGLKAAMKGVLALGAMRALAAEPIGPGALLDGLNREMLRAQDGGFITCVILRILPDGTLACANAGHIPPYWNGEEMQVDAGLPLGMAPGVMYAETTIRLKQRDRLTLITDGVLEARSLTTGELFGFERTAEISTQSAESIAQRAQQFGQEDDITVLTLRLVSSEVAQ
jgi:sigma-B regulation protein RsbU (phosphoserine phosphatase)